MKRYRVVVAVGLSFLSAQSLCRAQKNTRPPWPVHELKSHVEKAELNELIKKARREWSLRENSALARRVQKMAEKGAKTRIETVLSPDKKKFLRITGYVPEDSYHAGIYDARTGKLLRRLPSPKDECGGAMEGQWSPDGRLVSFSEVEGEGRFFFDARTGRKVWEGPENAIFAPDSQHLAILVSDYSVSSRYSVSLCSIRLGKEVGHSALIPIRDVPVFLGFSPAGRRLFLSGSGDSSNRSFSVRVR